MELNQTDHMSYINLKYRSNSSSRNFAILKLSVQNDELLNLYKIKVADHNTSFMNNIFADSGFDLFVPNDVTFDNTLIAKYIDMQVKVELLHCDIDTDVLQTVPFYLYPRSSISKTPLMLANHTGVIDSGYRGNIIGAFRSFEDNYTVSKHTRLVQLCHVNLLPIYVIIVKDDDLSTTERGDGGFGSTGK